MFYLFLNNFSKRRACIFQLRSRCLMHILKLKCTGTLDCPGWKSATYTIRSGGNRKLGKQRLPLAFPSGQAFLWVKSLSADGPAEMQICYSEQENALINTLSQVINEVSQLGPSLTQLTVGLPYANPWLSVGTQGERAQDRSPEKGHSLLRGQTLKPGSCRRGKHAVA